MFLIFVHNYFAILVESVFDPFKKYLNFQFQVDQGDSPGNKILYSELANTYLVSQMKCLSIIVGAGWQSGLGSNPALTTSWHCSFIN